MNKYLNYLNRPSGHFKPVSPKFSSTLFNFTLYYAVESFKTISFDDRIPIVIRISFYTRSFPLLVQRSTVSKVNCIFQTSRGLPEPRQCVFTVSIAVSIRVKRGTRKIQG